MASWGDINAALNKLVGEGVIAGFRTNRGDKTQAGLHVNIVPAGADDVESVRTRILNLLQAFDDEVTVTVGSATTAG